MTIMRVNMSDNLDGLFKIQALWDLTHHALDDVSNERSFGVVFRRSAKSLAKSEAEMAALLGTTEEIYQSWQEGKSVPEISNRKALYAKILEVAEQRYTLLLKQIRPKGYIGVVS